MVKYTSSAFIVSCVYCERYIPGGAENTCIVCALYTGWRRKDLCTKSAERQTLLRFCSLFYDGFSVTRLHSVDD
jgi:hypothetical protein